MGKEKENKIKGLCAPSISFKWDYPVFDDSELDHPHGYSTWIEAAEEWKDTIDPEVRKTTTFCQQEDSHASRFNSGKPRLSLIPACAQKAEALVWGYGADKYTENNWKSLWGDKTTQVVCDSAMRHMLAIQEGEVYDEESGLPHAAHVRCNMAMLLYYYETQKKED